MEDMRLPKDLEDRLDRLVRVTGRTKTFFISQALKKYLEEHEGTFLAVAQFEQTMEAASSDEEEGSLQRREKNPDLSASHTAAEGVASRLRNSRIRVLVADDSSVNRAVALVMLKRLGYQADSVTNGAEAISALESVPYDLVLMDCQMPKMDGYEATALIRKPESNVLNHDIPIIAITAHATKEDRDRCLATGMNDHLAKPLQPDELEERLNSLFSKSAGETTDP